MNYLRLGLVCALFAAATSASGQADQDISAEVDRIFEKAENAVAENHETFIKANERPLGDARTEMSDLIDRLNKQGNTQLATTVDKATSLL